MSDNEVAQVRDIALIAKSLRSVVEEQLRLPDEVGASADDPVIDTSLLSGTRGYVKKVGHQINNCYLATAYDGCAVMIRRLLETLLVEAFIYQNRPDQIKNGDDFVMLSDLISVTLNQSDWHLGRNVRKGLLALKAVGDLSAHARMYNARRTDIEKAIPHLRVVVEWLVYHAGFRQ